MNEKQQEQFKELLAEGLKAIRKVDKAIDSLGQETERLKKRRVRLERILEEAADFKKHLRDGKRKPSS